MDQNSFKDSDFKISSMCFNATGCVAVAVGAQGVAVRDTKNKNQPDLQFNKEEWAAFIAGVKRGEFDP